MLVTFEEEPSPDTNKLCLFRQSLAILLFMPTQEIILKNVRVHNVQGVDLTLPSHTLIVFTGVSGSGKSSLAFDTLYAEGQRRYIESLSTYARRQIGELPRPKIDSLEGLSPTLAIEQKTTGKNPRSTVGTLTGIYDFLRVLFARLAIPYCPVSQEKVSPQSSHQILAQIFSLKEQSRLIFLSPFVEGKKGEFKEEFADLVRKGFTKARLDGTFVDLSEEISLDGHVSHDVDLVIDRVVLLSENKARIAEAIEAALEQGQGRFKLLIVDSQKEKLFSRYAYSPTSGLSYSPLEPQDFSFNHPSGMCPSCQGLGLAREFNLDKILHPDRSLSEEFCEVGGSSKTLRLSNIYRNLAKLYRSDINTPWKDLPNKLKEVILYGTKERWTKMTFIHPEKKSWTEYVEWKGILHEAKERYLAAQSDAYRKKFEPYLHETLCQSCKGSRLKPYPSAAKLGGLTLCELTALSIQEAAYFLSSLVLTETEKLIGEELVKEVIERLSFLEKVGLHYLSLDRSTPSLSGGEGQRVRLASQIGSGLVGATYILDEPSIGLHPKDSHKLLNTLIHLKEKGNTVIVVEHDEETISAADTIVDVGPLAGTRGGKILVKGSLQDLLEAEDSLTGGYLSGRLALPASKERKVRPEEKLTLYKASHHNLCDLTVSFPLGLFIAVTGVSGSGKSSLVMDTLYPTLSNRLQASSLPVGSYERLEGGDKIDKIIAIDQSPIGRTPRSNPATYIKLFDEIRDLFSSLPDSQAKGFLPGRFSFNVSEGCCTTCQGMGMLKVDMDFLEDAWIPCTTCEGKRFDDSTLSVRFKGKNIHEILEMTVEEAFLFFEDQPKIRTKISLLIQVGLDYLQLGQPSPTLSGGESQRIKLAKELSRPSTGKTLYILDEPTTGLHFHDIKKLIEVLQALVDKGNTLVVIEHNMDLVKAADWIIDLGPEAGKEGGRLVSEGTVKQTAKKKSATGLALKAALAPKKPLLRSSPQSSASLSSLRVRGACQNNLKEVDAEIPLGGITVCTGPSGSGKSSFAFETLYAEGQRRYTESLSHYARQFVKQMPRPKVDSIEGLSASIAIEQKQHAGNPRSTVGTLSEIYDYLRILYCHLGTPFCPDTGEEIKQVSLDYVLERALSLPLETKLLVLSPCSLHKGESFETFRERMQKLGYLRIRLDREIYSLEDPIPFDPKKKHELSLVIDRLTVKETNRQRLREALEQATKISKDRVLLMTPDKDFFFHLAFTVESTGKSYSPITPHTFSFNVDQGMCMDCQGLGFQYGARESLLQDLLLLSPLDLLLLLCKEYLSLPLLSLFTRVFKRLGIDPDEPLERQSKEALHLFFQGEESLSEEMLTWKGLLPLLIQYTKSTGGNMRQILSSLLDKTTCSSCEGSRLSPLARNVRIDGVSLPTLCRKPVEQALSFVEKLPLPRSKEDLLAEPLEQIKRRLRLLIELGLDYLSLDRGAPSLSGGETQRIRLSRQLGSGLTGCLYVLDEPTIGLHPHDNHLLNKALKKLKDLGNTLVLVEHDPMTIQIADYLLDFGPKAGKQGGQILARGSLQEILQDPLSLTGAYLSGRRIPSLPIKRRKATQHLLIQNVALHNINNLSLSLPVGVLTGLTGVSGSGKSTLLLDIVQPCVERHLAAKRRRLPPPTDLPIQGLEAFDKLIVLDQDPIGTTNRADIATYTELLTPLRHLFASLPEAKARGLQAKHFSYNYRKGMCTSCWGHGTKTVSLQFLPSIQVPCDACKGLKLTPSALQVKWKDKNLGEILKLTVEEALTLFSSIPKITRILETLCSVGLDYLTLGQEVASLSGGESQRLRLSTELSKRSTGKTLYLFDEPSIGLHSTDIEKFIPILHALVTKGNTVLLIEHHLDLIAQCDYLIDMGPGGGPKGGLIIAEGTPEEVSLSHSSKTAPFLKEHLDLLRKEPPSQIASPATS